MQSVQLSIPKPCHENWDKMTPTQQGKFCNACAKQVVDFTTMSDGEVLNYFLKNKDENVCGRTLPQQLDRVLEAPKPIVPSKLWYWKYAAAGLLFFTKASTVQAQSVTPYTPKEINSIEKTLQGRVGQIQATAVAKKVIDGNITDEQGNPIPFASIKIKGTHTGVSADANGLYKISVDYNSTVLEISAIGFEMKSVDVSNAVNFTTQLLRSKRSIEGEIVVVGMVGRIAYSPKPQKHLATIKVTDAATNKIIDDATLYVKEEDDLAFDTIQLNNGTYKIKNVEEYDEYTIQASKEGYESKAIVLSEENFNKRKGVFEIELKKKEVPLQGVNVRGDVKIRLGGISSVINNNQPLYVVDGAVVTSEFFAKVNPNDIKDITVLKGSQATSVYGSSGVNGVIVITSKKRETKEGIKSDNSKRIVACKTTGLNIGSVKSIENDSIESIKYKLMGEVVVEGKLNRKVNSHILGSVSVVLTEDILKCGVSGMSIKTSKTDTLKQKILNLFSPIKIYPNPAQKGQPINISFSNKYNSYAMQVVNALGEVVLYQRRQHGLREAGASFKKITEQIIISPQWSSGYYLINILNEQGKVVAKDGFLVL